MSQAGAEKPPDPDMCHDPFTWGLTNRETRDLHEGDGEVEALPQPLEGDEGLRGEAPGGHLAVGPLVFAGGALALEPPDQQVDAGSSVLTHPWGAAAGAGIHLAVLPWKGRRRHQGRQYPTQAARCGRHRDPSASGTPNTRTSAAFQHLYPAPSATEAQIRISRDKGCCTVFQVWILRVVESIILFQIFDSVGPSFQIPWPLSQLVINIKLVIDRSVWEKVALPFKNLHTPSQPKYA